MKASGFDVSRPDDVMEAVGRARVELLEEAGQGSDDESSTAIEDLPGYGAFDSFRESIEDADSQCSSDYYQVFDEVQLEYQTAYLEGD